MKKLSISLLAALLILASCNNDENNGEPEVTVNENPGTFKEIGSITIGGEAAAEISAYCEKTKRLFTVNNSGVNQIDVIDIIISFINR